MLYCLPDPCFNGFLSTSVTKMTSGLLPTALCQTAPESSISVSINFSSIPLHCTAVTFHRHHLDLSRQIRCLRWLSMVSHMKTWWHDMAASTELPLSMYIWMIWTANSEFTRTTTTALSCLKVILKWCISYFQWLFFSHWFALYPPSSLCVKNAFCTMIIHYWGIYNLFTCHSTVTTGDSAPLLFLNST